MPIQECPDVSESAHEEFARLLDGLAPFSLTEDQYDLGIVSLPKDVLPIFWCGFDELKKNGIFNDSDNLDDIIKNQEFDFLDKDRAKTVEE